MCVSTANQSLRLMTHVDAASDFPHFRTPQEERPICSPCHVLPVARCDHAVVQILSFGQGFGLYVFRGSGKRAQ